MKEGEDNYKLGEEILAPEQIFKNKDAQVEKLKMPNLAEMFRDAEDAAQRFQAAIQSMQENLDELKEAYAKSNNARDRARFQKAIDQVEDRINKEGSMCGKYAARAEELRREFNKSAGEILGMIDDSEKGQ